MSYRIKVNKKKNKKVTQNKKFRTSIKNRLVSMIIKKTILRNNQNKLKKKLSKNELKRDQPTNF